jgi:hypothetical protein
MTVEGDSGGDSEADSENLDGTSGRRLLDPTISEKCQITFAREIRFFVVSILTPTTGGR